MKKIPPFSDFSTDFYACHQQFETLAKALKKPVKKLGWGLLLNVILLCLLFNGRCPILSGWKPR